MQREKKILLAGLTEREAAAVQMLVESTWRDCSCVILPRLADFQMPVQSAQAQACSGVVVNLLGVGLLRYSEQAQSKLAQLLDGRSAVLLLHSGDPTWGSLPWPAQPGQMVLCLTPPCSSEALRNAIRQAGLLNAVPGLRLSAQQKLSPSSNPNPNPNLNSAHATASLDAAHSSSTARPQLGATLAPQTSGAYLHMGNGALTQLERAVPVLQSCEWLKLIQRSLAVGRQSRFQIGPTVFVMDMRAGWLATLLPVSALQKMLQTPQLLGSVQLQALDEFELLPAAGQDFGVKLPKAQKALDSLVWELSSEALKSVHLGLDGDFSLRLRRYPNFTQLERVGSLDMQLATLCASAPRSLRELLGLFASYEQEVLRFAVLCVLSGQAVLATHQPSPAGSQALSRAASTNSREDAPERAAKRGFLKSLLNKLF